MRVSRVLAIAVVSFALGMGVMALAGKKSGPLDPSAYRGREAQEAAATLLEKAEAMLRDKDSWELIGVGRAHYLAGGKEKGQAIFDRVMKASGAKSDMWRIARVYAEAGEWERAEPLFRKVLEMSPEDDSGQIEAGAHYNLNGQRERAEELFTKAFARDSENIWHYVSAGGSYLGVTPR